MEKNICDVLYCFFVFNSIWFEFCFQITTYVILLHIWILEYIFCLYLHFDFYSLFLLYTLNVWRIIC